jgi:DNA-binding MarR family transcriptional regulator
MIQIKERERGGVVKKAMGKGSGESARDCCLEEMGELVRRLVRAFQMFERDRVRVLGFTFSQCYTLLEVSREDGISMNDLSERMNLDCSTMTRVVDLLVRDGWLERRRGSDDGRKRLVYLTAGGSSMASRIREDIEAYYREVLSNLPEGRVDEVLGAAMLLQEALRKSNPNCC